MLRVRRRETRAQFKPVYPDRWGTLPLAPAKKFQLEFPGEVKFSSTEYSSETGLGMAAFRIHRLAARLPASLPRATTPKTCTRAYVAVAAPKPIWTASPLPTPGQIATQDRSAGVGGPLANEAPIQANTATQLRNDWTREEISKIYHGPLMELVYQAVSHLRGSHGRVLVR